jgi:hypothetical protein
MIDRQEAERIAIRWARQETERLGYRCTPVLDEFDVGYLVRSRPGNVPGATATDAPTGTVGPLLGSVIIDKETGELSRWPGLPPAMVRQMYRADRAGRTGKPYTVAPPREDRRGDRTATPGLLARLTVRHERYVAHGAKGDLTLRHHPLVRGFLVRGGERHAELIVVSEVLYEYDQRRAAAGRPPLTRPEAQELLGTAQLELFRIREPGDPAGGVTERPCESCVLALVHFGVLPWSHLGFAEEWRPDPQPAPVPGRFPAEVAHALVEGGWRPGPDDPALAREAIDRVCTASGGRLRSFPAAEATLTAFPGLVCARRGAGREVWIRRFEIRPTAVAQSAASLTPLARLLGCQLFPIGTEDGDSILAVDEQGRIFALDQAGEWFLGPNIDAALGTLLLGRAPGRVHDDGTW